MDDDDRRYAEDLHRVEHARSLAEDLADLEATNPEVADAAAAVDRFSDRCASELSASGLSAAGRAEALRLVSEGRLINRAITHVHDFGVGW